MRYYKQISNSYIIAIGIGGGGEEIAEQEYNEIMTVIQNKPARTENTDFHLKTDLTWEEYERSADPDPEPSDEEKAEAYDILTGVRE